MAILFSDEELCSVSAVGSDAVSGAAVTASGATRKSQCMAESVTHHASNPSLEKSKNQIIHASLKIRITADKRTIIQKQHRYAGREFAKPANTLPNSLPEITEQNQHILRVVESVHMGRGGYLLCL